MGLFKISKRMEKSMNTFGFIGMGNMGYAMLKGALNSFSKEDIIFTCPSSDRREKISEETGVRFAESNAECANNAKYIILAVKPQVYDVVLKNIHDIVTEESIVISLAPGITITDIKRKLGDNIRVVRAMPNTPALVGEGMTGISYNTAEFSFEERDIIEKFFFKHVLANLRSCRHVLLRADNTYISVSILCAENHSLTKNSRKFSWF